MRRDEISYARDLAQAQLLLDPPKGVKRFEEFQHILFPWLETAKKRAREISAAEVRKFVQGPPLVVQSMLPQKSSTAVSYLQRKKAP